MDNNANIMHLSENLLAEFIFFIQWAQWFYIAFTIISFVDLYWGVRKAAYQKQEIRASRALRKTLLKICEYLLFVLLAYVAHRAFCTPLDFPLLPVSVLFVLFLLECESVASNYAAAKGKKITWSFNWKNFINKKTDGMIQLDEQKENETK